MSVRASLIAWLVVFLLVRAARGEESAPRPVWNQDKAVEIVQKCVDLEAHGQPWDKIAWMEDVPAAVARAKKEDKPLFVYFFLKKNVGPAAAPC